jgi:hypothetical protein
MDSSASVIEPPTKGSFSCSFGLLIVAVSYLGFVLSLRFVLSEECLVEPCQSEGVDDTYLAWGSDFFVAAVCFLLGIHLHCFKRSTRRSGTVAHVFMAGSFALTGFRARFYSNGGQTDNMGMLEHWVVGAVATVFLTLSATAQAYFAMETAALTPRSKHPFCAFFFMRLWLAAIILTAIINIVGSVWCSLTEHLQTDELVDNYQDNLYWNERHVCLQLIGFSENFIWLPYALLWIPVGLLLRAAALHQPSKVLGLSNARAALGAVGFQWITGSMYLVVVSFVSWIRNEMELTDDETFLQLWNRVYGVEMFHLGMLLSTYCAHNLVWTLTLPTSTAARLTSGSSVMTTNQSPVVFASGDSDEHQKSDDSEAKHVRFSEEVLSTTDVDLEADAAEAGETASNDEGDKKDDDDSPAEASAESTTQDDDIADNATVVSSGKRKWRRLLVRQSR